MTRILVRSSVRGLVMAICLLAAHGMSPLSAANNAIDFGGSTSNTNTYVSFADPNSLKLTNFTLEAWIRRDGAGVTTSTGTGGLTAAVPMITKGRAQADASNLDMNYFLGFNGTFLAADFEEAAAVDGGVSPGLNHPITGTMAVSTGVWHHVAVSYDGSCWKLYLDGVLDPNVPTSGSVGCPARPVRWDSIQKAAIASAQDSNSIASGFYDGAMDEVRIWKVARTGAQILSSMNLEIASDTNLAARWSLNEGTSNIVNDSTGGITPKTITGTNFLWIAGAPPLNANLAPNQPTLNAPANGAIGVAIPPTLNVGVTDPESSSMTVTFLGRPAAGAPPNFTLVALPDTQFYSELYPATYTAQTQWILNNKDPLNIKFMTQLGDCVQNGDTNQSEWDNADAAISLIENPITTLLPDGLPYGISVGNHDQSPLGTPGTLANESATTNKYNATFGVTRFQGRGYYGGHFGSNNDNHYELFSASGMDFINISLEYDPNMVYDPNASTPLGTAVLNWANGLLQTYSSRRAIVTSHYILNPSGTFGPQGQQIYNALKGNPNLFLMLSGHLDQAARRSDTFNGHTVHTLLSDFQTQPNGGNGWLRYMIFKPGENKIYVYTYSPTLNQSKTDASNQFVLDYQMSSNPFVQIAQNAGVASGSSTTAAWNGLTSGTQYEWYVTASDGVSTTTGPTWTFTTQTTCTPTGGTEVACDGVDDDCDGFFDEDYVAQPSSCGLGACASSGMTSCVNGLVQNNCTPGNPSLGTGLSFDGSSGYVLLGDPNALDLASFTLETWFKKTGVGVGTNTGTGGFASALPLVTKGRAEAEASNVDMNYFLGIRTDTNVLAADFEDSVNGTNHPISGVTPIVDGVWYHAAATYDGATWRLYLDGALEATLAVNVATRSDSIQRAAIGSALNSTDVAQGFFAGEMDEVRIWSSVRTQSQIGLNRFKEISSASGLAARWGMNEGLGTSVDDSAGASDGSLQGVTAWISDSPVTTETTCDGIDNDCDGLTDEDYAPNATCGVGACHTSNTPSTCTGGVETACQPGTPAPDDSACNGVDDDCNGATDEDFVPSTTSCGTGACLNTGSSTCVNGVLGSTCQPGQPTANYGMDFDGVSEYVTFGPAPGLNASAFTIETWFNRHGTGATTLTGSGGVDAVPLVTKGRAEAEGSNVDMNWFLGIRGSDNVLVADFEDMASGANHPIAGVTPIVTDTWYHAAATYDGATWRIYLNGVLEATLLVNATPRSDSIQHAAIATAMDSNGIASGTFDGVIDEARVWNVARSDGEIATGMGQEIASASGLLARWGFNEGGGSVLHDSAGASDNGTIVGGTYVGGTPLASGPAPQLDHALDYSGTSSYTTFGQASSLGSAVFTIETWFNRQGVGTTTNTGTGGLVAIPLVTKGRAEAEGSTVDMNWFLGIRGSDNVLAADFEDMASGTNHPVTGVTPIVTGKWYHAAAVYDGTTWRLYLNGNLEASLVVGATPRSDSIQHAAIGTAMNSTGTPEGFFNGLVDEARVWSVARSQSQIVSGMRQEITSTAGLLGRWGFNEGTGTFAEDTAGTSDGTVVSAAWVDGYPFHAFAIASDESCNGVDDDCDGTVDEDFVGTPTTCGTGACGSSGTTTCTNGTPGNTCAPGSPTGIAESICNGVDDDCDGAADEDFVSTPTACGTGACGSIGNTTCTSGAPGNTCTPGSPTGIAESICNGVDDDCDGTVDEDFVSAPTACGTGACGSSGTTTCTNGTPGNTCTPGSPTGIAESICNGVDDDCDGATDEDFVSTPTSCGTGACGSIGNTTCTSGTPGNTCTPGSPTGIAESICNGVDDDCDGATDEDFVSAPTACGTGACGSSGTTTCTNGTPGNTCTPGSPTGIAESICNGVDDDCDGTTDEEFVGTPTTCGEGDCSATGTTTCTNGTPGNTCHPGSPTGIPETICNGVDDDCDGAADEDFVGTPTTCGTGACGSSGTTTCTSGAMGDTCTPGSPTGIAESICNGVDDDCDGSTDENFVGTPTSCGTGACGSSGTTTCTNGTPGNTCTPGSPTGVAESICNGVDDDCDGAADEDFVSTPTTCGVGACPNSTGMLTCVSGSLVDTCNPLNEAPAVLVEFGSQMKYSANVTSEEDVELVGFGTLMSYVANLTDPGIPGVAWTAEVFDDALWAPGSYGVGYETTPPGAVNLLQTTVSPGTFSVFTRAHFDINEIAGVRRLYLGVDYDDGYVAWINGVEVARSSTMPAGVPVWNADAASHESGNGAVPSFGALIDITIAASAALHEGDNVLAIGVWNTSATASTDLVLVPRLSMTADWTRESFDDSLWASGSYGVGYETAPPGATALLGTTVPPGTFSVYTRTTFTLSNASAVDRLMLGVDYDDGYVAYINGVEVLSAPEVPLGALRFDTSAELHESSNGAAPNYNPLHDISQYGVPALHDGVNVLAIGIWNHTTSPASTDLVLVPRLSIFEGELCDGLDNDCDGSIDEGFPNTDGGSTADCVDPDDDNDGVPDANDCAPFDPLSSAGPVLEVSDLTWVRGTVRRHIMTWPNQGSGVVYDIAGGDASALIPDGGAFGATCMVDDLAQAFFDDPQPGPLPGHARYYLVRAQKSNCGTSTYGFDSSGVERVPTDDCQ